MNCPGKYPCKCDLDNPALCPNRLPAAKPKEAKTVAGMRAIELYELRRTLNRRTLLYRAVVEELSKRERKANTRVLGGVAG